ncbi:MAG: GNAT family protein [Thermoleophilia bacterium]
MDVGERVSVRPARVRDARRLAEIGAQVAAEPEGWLVSDGGWSSAAAERRAIRLARWSGNVAILVAELDGRVVGRLSILRDQRPACRHVADVGLMVEHGQRGRGVGTAMLRAAEEWAREQGVEKLELHVFPHNVVAIGLYERLGYVREGVRSRHFHRRGEYVDAILMAKDVRAAPGPTERR